MESRQVLAECDRGLHPTHVSMWLSERYTSCFGPCCSSLSWETRACGWSFGLITLSLHSFPALRSVIINFIELVSRFSRWLSIASLPTCTHVTLDEIIQRLSNPSSPMLETLQPGTLLADHPAVLNFKIARHKILVIPFVLQHHFKLKPCTHRGHVSEDPKP